MQSRRGFPHRTQRWSWPLAHALAAVLGAACGGAATAPVAPAPAVAPATANTIAPVAAAAVGAAPYAIMLVICGTEAWLGSADNPRVLNALKTALDDADLAHTAPADAQMALVTYAGRPVFRIPFGPISNFTGGVLGEPRDYAGATGNDLAGAVEIAMVELERVRATKKYLFVVSDDRDHDSKTARQRLAALKKRTAGAGIYVRALTYRNVPSRDRTVTGELTDRQVLVGTSDGLRQVLARDLQNPEPPKHEPPDVE